MIILTIRKNLLNAIIVLTFAIMVGAIFLNITVKNQHKMIFTITDKLEEPFMSSSLVPSIMHNDIEIFDIEKGKVIKVVQINEIIMEEAQKYFQSIVDMYTKVKAFPDRGYIIKITFESNIIVNNPLINDYGIESIDKFFILLPEQSAPYILVLDNRERPFFYYSKREISKLLKSLNFKTDYPK